MVISEEKMFFATHTEEEEEVSFQRLEEWIALGHVQDYPAAL